MLTTRKRWRSDRHREAAAALWDEYRADPCPATRNRLAELYLPLVRYHAKWVGRHLEAGVAILGIGDLVSAGAMGLMQAIESYDPGAHVAFETYCFPRVRGAMRDAMRATDHLGRRARRGARSVIAARDTLRAELGREPDDEETAAAMGCTVPDYLRDAAWAGHADVPGSIEQGTGCRGHGRDAATIAERLADRRLAAPSGAELADDVAEVLRTLPPVDRRIMTMYYIHEMTMKDVGLAIGLAESRISQRIAEAIATIRRRYADLGRMPIGGTR